MLIDYRSSGVASTKITQLLAYAVGDGSEHNARHILETLYSDGGAKLCVWMADGEEAAGLIGWRVQGNSLEILHIAVDEGMRHRDIGGRLIAAVVAWERPHSVLAETDQDAVGFYRHYGFTIQSLGEKYPGVERFQCRWRPPGATDADTVQDV